MKIGNLEVYGIIYKITNLINGKVYIGQTTRDGGFNDRYNCSGVGIERVYKYYKREEKITDRHSHLNNHLIKSIEKYGLESFEVNEIFDFAFSQEELNIKEIVYIKYYDCIKNGYNTLEGGQITPYHNGESTWNSKYNNEQIYQVKKMLSENKSFEDIKEYTGVSMKTIENIYFGKSWNKIGIQYNKKIDELREAKKNAKYFDCNLNKDYLYSCHINNMSLKDILMDIGYFNNCSVKKIKTGLKIGNIRGDDVRKRIQETLDIFKAKDEGKEILICEKCGREFIKTRYDKYGCLCYDCKREHRIETGEIKFCEVCGKEFVVNSKNKSKKYCTKCAKSKEIKRKR